MSPFTERTRATDEQPGPRTTARLPYRPLPPPPTRRQELRRAAAVQAAWLAELR